MIPAACLFIAAAQRSAEPIVTDRPDFTESAVVIPLRSLQIESGGTVSWPGGSRTLTLPEVLIRSSIDARSELRVGLPNWNSLESESGFDDLYLGAKVQFGPVGRWDVAVIPAIYVPVGSAAFRAERTAPEVKLAYSTELDARTSLSAMTSGLWLSESGRRVVDWGQTFSLGIGIDERTAAFLEYAGTFRHRAEPGHVLHAGFTFKPSSERQWDVHFGMSLSGSGRDPFVGVGYSVRF